MLAEGRERREREREREGRERRKKRKKISYCESPTTASTRSAPTTGPGHTVAAVDGTVTSSSLQPLSICLGSRPTTAMTQRKHVSYDVVRHPPSPSSLSERLFFFFFTSRSYLWSSHAPGKAAGLSLSPVPPIHVTQARSPSQADAFDKPRPVGSIPPQDRSRAYLFCIL